MGARRCIFCLEEKSVTAFNSEHVFPESIGGTYEIDLVCIDCNSRLGHEVDTHLIEHFFIKSQRMILKLPGKSGKVPNIFERAPLASNPESIVRLEPGENGQSNYLYFQPRKTVTHNEDGTQTHSIHVDERDESLIQEIEAKLERRIKGTVVSKSRSLSSITNPKVNLNFQIDEFNYRRAIVKIAYELACVWLGEEYLNDPMSETLRGFVFCVGSSEECSKRFPVIGDVQYTMSAPDQDKLMPMFYTGDHSHVAFLKCFGGDLSIYVKVFDVIEGFIMVTDQVSRYSGVNDFLLHMNPVTKELCKSTLTSFMARELLDSNFPKMQW